MKFTCTVDIKAPLDKVAEYFADPKYLNEYQDGFQSKKLLKGVEGKVGAVSLMQYDTGKMKMDLTETIVKNDLPHEFIGQYHHKHTDNTMHNTFEQIDPSTTRYTSVIEYTAFRGIMINIMAKLFPGMFKKQVMKWLNNFKVFVESQV